MAKLIEETDVCTVASLPVLIYGPPGAGKTSLAQTAADPFTLDFDKGIHRSGFRRRAMQFERWGEVEDAWAFVDRAGTVVIDTVGTALDAIALQAMADDGKAGTRSSGLTMKGYGIVGNRFNTWIKSILDRGKDVVLICHEEEHKDVAGTRTMRPSMLGNMAYNELSRVSDLWGYIRLGASGERVLDFSPTSEYKGKNAAQFDPIRIPSLREHPMFLAGLLAEAKKRIGHTAASSAARAQAVAEWSEWLVGDPNLEQFNAKLPELKEYKNGTKAALWEMLVAHATKEGLVFDGKAKQFVPKAAEPAAS